MCPVVLFAPPRGVAALACCSVASFSFTRSDPARAQDGDARSTEILAGHRRDLHPHRHPQQQRQQRPAAEGPATADSRAAAKVAATSSGDPVVGGIAGTSTTIITAEEIERAPQSTLAGHPVARSRHPDDQPLWRRQRHRHGGRHARLRRHRAVEHAGAGGRTPLQRFRYRRVRFQPDSAQQHRPHRDHPRQQRRRALRRRRGRRRHQHRDQERRRCCSRTARIEGAFGSFNTREGKVSSSGSYNGLVGCGVRQLASVPTAIAPTTTTGKINGVGDFDTRPTKAAPSSTSSVDDSHRACPGRALISLSSAFNRIVDRPPRSDTPFDYGNRQNLAMRGGVTRKLATAPS